MKPSVFVLPTRTIYVDKYSLRSGENGSIDHPFKTIQAAIDHAESMSSTHSEQVEIVIGCGLYIEPTIFIRNPTYLVIRGSTSRGTYIQPTGSGPAFFITNATLESAANYLVTGVYSDLLPQSPAVPGIQRITFKDIGGYCSGKNIIMACGVKGDNSPTTTGFLGRGIYIDNCVFQSLISGIVISFFVQNCDGTVSLIGSDLVYTGLKLLNCRSFVSLQNPIGYLYYEYNSLSPDGLPKRGFLGANVYGCEGYSGSEGWYIRGDKTFNLQGGSMDGHVRVQGSVTLNAYDFFFMRELTIEDTAAVTLRNSYVKLATTIGATVTFTSHKTSFESTFLASPGDGVITIIDGGVEGVVTDTSTKIIYRETNKRSGTATGAGAGDVPVAFATALSRTDYKVALGNIGSGGAVVKPGSKTVNGFTLTFAAAGDCDWTATLGQ